MNMAEIIAKYLIIFFGIFFICVGFLMLIKPEKARATLRKAGSTNLINYGEITIRIIPAVALIIISDLSKYPLIFNLFGWFMLLTSVVLYFVPKKLHHDFSNKCADFLKPVYFQLIAPFSMTIGIVLIYCVV